MIILYSIFFGAGVAGFTYTRMGRRLGYENQQNVWVTVAVSFILASIFFYTLLTLVLGMH